MLSYYLVDIISTSSKEEEVFTVQLSSAETLTDLNQSLLHQSPIWSSPPSPSATPLVASTSPSTLSSPSALLVDENTAAIICGVTELLGGVVSLFLTDAVGRFVLILILIFTQILILICILILILNFILILILILIQFSIRRPLLLTSYLSMSASLFLLSLAHHLQTIFPSFTGICITFVINYPFSPSPTTIFPLFTGLFNITFIINSGYQLLCCHFYNQFRVPTFIIGYQLLEIKIKIITIIISLPHPTLVNTLPTLFHYKSLS